MNYRHTTASIVIPRVKPLNDSNDERFKNIMSTLNIAAGSGIAAVELEGGYKVYYEGNVNGACNLHEIDDRIICAAGRAMTNYPTVAFIWLPASDYESLFMVAGNVDLQNGRLTTTYFNKVIVDTWAKQYVPVR